MWECGCIIVDPSRIFDEFPAPSYRGMQRQALEDIQAAFRAGNDVVLVRAPTGSGKSLLARAIAGCARRVEDAAPAEPTDAYYTTPQVSQLDDVTSDDLLDDLNVIRGKGNYSCILPGETTTPVNKAPCVRQRGFSCPVQHRCPYFADRAIAANRPIAAMTLAYFMQTAGSDVFGKRDVVVIDEAHGLSEWAEMYATIELSPRTVPVWESCRPPKISDLVAVEQYAERVQRVCTRRRERLQEKSELTPDEAEERDRLQEIHRELGWLRDDLRDPDSPTMWVVDQPDGKGTAVTIKPVDPARYLHHTVWNRGEKFVLLSATILSKEGFCRSAGLDPSTVALVDVPHTFPVENRPLFDITQGKMTYEHRDETLPKIARTVVQLMVKHPEEKGLIHAHSYDIADTLLESFRDFGVSDRVRAHDKQTRDAALDSWKRSDEPLIFLSVKMEEALDLGHDACRWQVLCKAPYPNTRDSRVQKRLNAGRWNWYYRATLRTVIQACGRVVRSPTDYGATYIADASILDVFDRAAGDMPVWFHDSVEKISHPTLPSFDPDKAVATARSQVNRSWGSDPSSQSSTVQSHPLSDVWGDK